MQLYRWSCARDPKHQWVSTKDARYCLFCEQVHHEISGKEIHETEVDRILGKEDTGGAQERGRKGQFRSTRVKQHRLALRSASE